MPDLARPGRHVRAVPLYSGLVRSGDPAGSGSASGETAKSTDAEHVQPAPEQPDAGLAGAGHADASLADAGLAETGARDADGDSDAPDLAGAVFGRLTVLPAIVVMAWLLPGLLLLLAGVFEPVPELLIGVPLAVVVAVGGLRHGPSRWPRVIPGPVRRPPWAAWWPAVGTVAVAAGFAVWQLLENSPSLIVTRDPGGYLQTGYWIAQHGSLPIPQSIGAFGGAHAGLGFSGVDFFAHGSSLVPAFTSGLPMVLAGAFWTHGVSAAAAASPVLGGLAILTFGGLVGRLAGQLWAPAGAAVLAVTLPEQFTSRSAFSETLVQILLFGGLCLVIDALTATDSATAQGAAGEGEARNGAAADGVGPDGVAPDWAAGNPGREDPPAQDTVTGSGRRGGQLDGGGWRSWLTPGVRARRAAWLTPQRVLAGLGGLALGLTVLADVSSLVFLLAVIPFAGVLAAGRRAAAIPFCAGVVTGTGYGLADGYLLSRPFMTSVQLPLELAGVSAAWLAALTLTAVRLLRSPRLRATARRLAARPPLRWLPEAGGLAVAAALIGFIIRPYLQVVRGQPSSAVAGYVGYLQRLQHLPVDPARLYAEDTLYWVIWYAGAPAVLLGGFGIALLVRRCLRSAGTRTGSAGTSGNWGLPLAVICLGSLVVLAVPDIAPDQPWASRRLVPVVIPGLILCAAWAAAWLAGLARARGAGTVTAAAVGGCCVAALALPAVATSFGAGLSHTGPGGGLRAAAGGLALRRTGAGQIGAVRGLCASIPPAASVLIVDRRLAGEFSQVIRGMCGVPVGWAFGGGVNSVLPGVLAGISRAGRRPVLLGASRMQLAAAGAPGGAAVKVLDLATTQPPHQLAQPPAGPGPVHYVIWMATAAPVAAGA